jgi:hypothetical protein
LAPYLKADLDLAAQQAQLAEQIAQRTQQLQACHERRGQLSEQIRRLAEDRRLVELRAEWDQLEREMAQMGRRWQVLALTSRLLEELRRRYERQYQPETLQEASEYFRRMSQGRYQRVWRPLDREELWVDWTEGGSLPVDRLSHGTRELLYLSLRLALVAAYARRGVRLPMILDDVMVNFDSERAQATAELLRDFALQGHQILLFTCHRHIQALFQSLRVPQATLPDWSRQPAPRVRLEIPSVETVLPVQKGRRRKTLPPPPAEPEGPEEGPPAQEPFGSQSAEAPSESGEPVVAEAESGKFVQPEPADPARTEPFDATNPDDDFQWYDRLVEEEDAWPQDGWPAETGPEETWPEETVPPLAQQAPGVSPDSGPPGGGLPAQIPPEEANRQKTGPSPKTRSSEKPAPTEKPSDSRQSAASEKPEVSEKPAESRPPGASEKPVASGHSPAEKPARSSGQRRSAEAA